MARVAPKRCAGCGRNLSLSHFNRRLTAPDGLQSRCRECQAKAKADRSLRLKDEARARVVPAVDGGLNQLAAEKTVAALRTAGALSDTDEDRIAALLSLARAIDADPGNAALWNSYLRVQQAIRVQGPEDAAARKAKSSRELMAKVRGSKPHPLLGKRPKVAPVEPSTPRATRRDGDPDLTVLDG